MNSGQIALPKPQSTPEPRLDLQPGRSQALATPPPPPPAVNGEAENKATAADQAVKRRRDSDGGGAGATKNGANGQAQVDPPLPQQRQRREEELPQVQEEVGFESRQSHINYELGDTPGLVPIVLIKGPSFVYLAPALAIINSPEFQELNGNAHNEGTAGSFNNFFRISSNIGIYGSYVIAFEVNYVMNTLLSFNMVIAFLVAVILDNTVPGSCQERGVYVWSEAEAARKEPAVSRDYELPIKVGL